MLTVPDLLAASTALPSMLFLLATREGKDLKRSLGLSEQGWFSVCCPCILASDISPWEQVGGDISCYWECEISNTSTQSLEKQLIWILIFTRNSSPFLSVWYCLKSSVRVTYFFFFFFASLHIGFKTYSFSWQTVYFRSVDPCIFLDLSLHSSFSGTSLTPLREPGLGIWLRQNSHLCFFSYSFLPSLYFHISSQHTPQLCFACQCQAAVPPSISLLMCVWFNFLPAGQVSTKPNTGHILNSNNTVLNPAPKPKFLQINKL